MNKRRVIEAPGITVTGPYAPAIESEDLVFFSGQTALEPHTGKLIQGSIAQETQQCFENLASLLKAAKLVFDDVQKVNVLLCDMADFEAMNAVYATYFNAPYPARTTVAAAVALPLGARVEIEMIARRPVSRG